MVRITDFMGRVGELLPGNDRVGEALGRKVGQVFDSTVDTSDAQRDAQDEGNRSRDRIYSENAGLSSGFTGEFAPPVLGPAVLENFLGMSHEEIMAFVRSMRPGEMYESVRSWRQLADDTAAAAEAFRAAIIGRVHEGWTGLAAEAAQLKVTEYVSDTDHLKQAALLVANKVEEAYSGFNQVVAQMPHPPEQPGSIASAVVGAIPVVGSSASAAMSMAYEGRSENAQNRAREVMDTVYKPVATQSDTNVPRIPGPAVPGVPEQSGGGVPPGTPSGTGTPSTGTPGSPSENANPDQQDTAGTDPGDAPSTTDDPGTTTGTEDESTSTDTDRDTDDSSTDQPTSQSPDSTVPAGTVPTSTTPTSTDPTRTGTPSSPSTPGSPGTPTATPAPGRSIPGTVVPDQAAAAAAARTANQTGNRSGMMGMPMSGARGKGDDDQEHQAPDYLRRVQEELLPQDQKTVPPVIGGD
ncbi:PPE domain-containing protein [Nocardia asteroides]|uniref:PPE domain-containing protein n=1 Tax=Nocardia asteroides TaxID=1824 RepID=UPI001E5BCC23|nr:PPE domain-containing protein [Nocardia asteroides]UGT59840.1 PPE domain-containing protein [Nocardia asteroides]